MTYQPEPRADGQVYTLATKTPAQSRGFWPSATIAVVATAFIVYLIYRTISQPYTDEFVVAAPPATPEDIRTALADVLGTEMATAVPTTTNTPAPVVTSTISSQDATISSLAWCSEITPSSTPVLCADSRTSIPATKSPTSTPTAIPTCMPPGTPSIVVRVCYATDSYFATPIA